MSSSKVEISQTQLQTTEAKLERNNLNGLDKRVSKSAISCFGQTVYEAVKSLASIVVKVIQVVADWIMRALRAIFCCGNIPNDEINSFGESLFEGDVDDLLNDFSSSLVPYQQVYHSIQPRSTLTPQSIKARLIEVPNLIFRFGNNEWWLQNPVFGGSLPSHQSISNFQQAFADMMKKAAEQPYCDIQIGKDLIVRMENPGYGRAIDGEALQQHTVHQLKAIMGNNDSQALVPKNNSQGTCPCRFCQQNAMVLKSSYFQIEIESENHRLDSPFCSATIPSDSEVWQFNIDLGKILERAGQTESLSIRLEDGPSVQVPFGENKRITDGQFGQILLAIADVQRIDPLARKAISLPEITEEAPRQIQRLDHRPDLSVVPMPQNPFESSPIEKPDAISSNDLAESLQAMAAQSYATSSVQVQERAPEQSLYPELGFAHGRNLLAYFIEDSTTVWNQPEISLGEAVKYCINLSESDNLLTERQKQGIQIFFEKLKAANGFDVRFWLNGKEDLQRILSSKLDKLLENPSPNHDQQLEIDLARAELATSFGYGIVPTVGGKNGAVFIKTFEGRSVGVFKAPHELGVFDFVEKMKCFFGQARLLSNRPMTQEMAEVVAGRLSRDLGFEEMAPKAIMASFGGEEGAFISFLDGYKELSKVRDVFQKREEFTDEEVIMWQMKEVWNKLIGNLDPHDENVFVKGTGEHIEKISMIDAGNSFPEYNPGRLGSRGNLAASVEYKISDIPFRSEVRQFINEHITEDKMEAFINNDSMIQEFYSPNMKNLQLQRVRLLQLVASGKIETPAKLAMVQTDSDYTEKLKLAD